MASPGTLPPLPPQYGDGSAQLCRAAAGLSSQMAGGTRTQAGSQAAALQGGWAIRRAERHKGWRKEESRGGRVRTRGRRRKVSRAGRGVQADGPGRRREGAVFLAKQPSACRNRNKKGTGPAGPHDGGAGTGVGVGMGGRFLAVSHGAWARGS